MSVASVLSLLGRRGSYGGSWKLFFDYLSRQGTPESDIFYWAEELETEGNTSSAKEFVGAYLRYRYKYGSVGEIGIIGDSEAIAGRLGFDFNWEDGSEELKLRELEHYFSRDK